MALEIAVAALVVAMIEVEADFEVEIVVEEILAKPNVNL